MVLCNDHSAHGLSAAGESVSRYLYYLPLLYMETKWVLLHISATASEVSHLQIAYVQLTTDLAFSIAIYFITWHTLMVCDYTEDWSAEQLACFPWTAFKIGNVLEDEPACEYFMVFLHLGGKSLSKSLCQTCFCENLQNSTAAFPNTSRTSLWVCVRVYVCVKLQRFHWHLLWITTDISPVSFSRLHCFVPIQYTVLQYNTQYNPLVLRW